MNVVNFISHMRNCEMGATQMEYDQEIPQSHAADQPHCRPATLTVIRHQEDN